MKIGLNRITMPDAPIKEFMKEAKKMGFDGVEVRNDLMGKEILDNIEPEEIKKLSGEIDIELVTINALQRFNDEQRFLDERYEELDNLVTVAKRAGIKGVILVPVNDQNDKRTYEERMNDTVAALNKFGPLFEKMDVQGLVEPLGFEICSLRFKKDAVKAIKKSNYRGTYSVVHDTFHHYLAQEKAFFPNETGLIHVSGVLPGKELADITDSDRVLVTDDDVMGNKAQINELIKLGYDGYVCYECFSEAVQKLEKEAFKEKVKESDNLLFSK